MRTISVRKEDVEREWFVIDLADVVVGRAATEIATILRGKHKPSFTPHNDTGDFVVAINADKVVFTGAKMTQKLYRRHTRYPGGLIEVRADNMLANHPEQIIRHAVWGMLPKGALGRKLIKKFKVYAGPEHPHVAQQPKALEI